MLNIKTFTLPPIGENCYVVSDETGEACIIDCGCFGERDWQKIRAYIDGENLKPVHLLATHLHFDHIMGCGFVSRDFSLQAEGSSADLDAYSQCEQYAAAFGLDGADAPVLPRLRDISTLTDISFGNHTFIILRTPGHTEGGLSFYCKEEGVVFVGDTLFQSSVGRTDLPGGSQYKLVESIRQQLFNLPPQTKVLCGHGPSTTIDYELTCNPYI